jgi:carbamoyltransferase
MRGPVLGLGGSNHDFSAAIVHKGEIKVAIEDERIQRVKQARTDWHSSPAKDAADYCLEATSLALDDLAGVFCCDDLERPREWLDWSRVTFVGHHVAHASASFFASPHDRATLLVVDGHGSALQEDAYGYEVETISAGWADDTRFELGTLESGIQQKTSSSWRYVTQNSIGWFYEIVTMALGFGDAGQGKTMGLSAYGTPRLCDPLSEFVESRPNGKFRFDPYGGISDWLAEILSKCSNAAQVRADIAYAAQEIFVDAIVAAALEAHRRFPARALCFGGGCALNTLANTRILEETPFESLSVFPASGDNGLSVGAAFYGAHVLLGQARRIDAPGWRARSVYTGKEPTEEEIEAALAEASVVASRPVDLALDACDALVGGETVAICRGGSEIGPRALGHRSLLSLPSPARMREHINLTIKQRESFRPLAPVVPLEHLSSYFEGVEESPYMLFVARVRDEFRHRLAAVTHIDGTARVQTVREEDNEFLHRLLGLVGQATGVPVLLNTSLNLRGEPIAETPRDAVTIFMQRPIDMLILGDWAVRKYSPWASPPLAAGAAV